MRSSSAHLSRRALLAAACSAALASGCGGSDAPVETQTGATPGILSLAPGWTVMEPGGGTTCARDTPYAYFVRPGTVNRVVIEFRGGGACWDEFTCGFSGSIFQETVQPDAWVLNEDLATGIYDHRNPDNPFRDWHHVYIPYCTGDIHWGDSVMTYGSGADAITIHHKGGVNTRAALDWVYENVPAPEKVFVTGCSAGAYGSIMWSAHLREHYKDAKVYQLADSGAGVVTDTFFQDSFPSWNAQASYPTWIPAVDGGVERLPLLYGAIGGHYPDMRLGQYNTVFDEDQIFFFQAMGGGAASDWSAAMHASVEEIAGATSNFRYFMAPGELHCIIPRPELYTAESNGVRLVDWIRDLVEDRPIDNVACQGDGCDAPP